MCVQSIKVPIRKKSGNLSYAPRISFDFYSMLHWVGNIQFTGRSLFFCYYQLSLGLFFGMELLTLFILKCQIILCISFSKRNSALCIYHSVVCSNFNFLHNSQQITFPDQPCRVLYCLYACLLHSPI